MYLTEPTSYPWIPCGETKSSFVPRFRSGHLVVVDSLQRLVPPYILNQAIADTVKNHHARLNRGRGFGELAFAFNPITAGIGAATSLVGTLLQYFTAQGAERDDTTNIVNYAQGLLQQNLAEYQNCQISQSTGQSEFNQVWLWVVQQCSTPALGSAGGACVQDRQRGGKFDWFAGYLDPISNTTPACASAAVSPAGVSVVSTSSSSDTVLGLPTGLILPAALILGALVLGGGL
jgi:hypothetical protein